MPSSEPEIAAPAIFLHVPKTAGTTLRGLFHQRLGDALCWFRPGNSRQPPDPAHPRVVSDLSTLGEPQTWRGMRVLGGHFPAWQLPLGLREQRPLLMAVLRDPLPRLESLYAYIRREVTHPLHATLSAVTFHEALVNTPFGRMVPQGQLRFLRTVQKPWKPEHLTPFPVLIGKHDHLPAFVEALSRRTGIALALGEASENVSPSGYRDEIAAQPGYADACHLIEQQTVDERAFLASFGALYEHEAGHGPVEPVAVRRAAPAAKRPAPKAPRGAAVAKRAPAAVPVPAAVSVAATEPVPASVSPEREARRQARREARRAQRQADRRAGTAGKDCAD